MAGGSSSSRVRCGARPAPPSYDVCDQQQWSALQQQFGSTGPTCGANIVVDAAGDPPPKKPGGCCDDGGAPLGLVWASAIALWLRRRRCTRSRASSDNAARRRLSACIRPFRKIRRSRAEHSAISGSTLDGDTRGGGGRPSDAATASATWPIGAGSSSAMLIGPRAGRRRRRTIASARSSTWIRLTCPLPSPTMRHVPLRMRSTRPRPGPWIPATRRMAASGGLAASAAPFHAVSGCTITGATGQVLVDPRAGRRRIHGGRRQVDEPAPRDRAEPLELAARIRPGRRATHDDRASGKPGVTQPIYGQIQRARLGAECGGRGGRSGEGTAGDDDRVPLGDGNPACQRAAGVAAADDRPGRHLVSVCQLPRCDRRPGLATIIFWSALTGLLVPLIACAAPAATTRSVPSDDPIALPPDASRRVHDLARRTSRQHRSPGTETWSRRRPAAARRRRYGSRAATPTSSSSPRSTSTPIRRWSAQHAAWTEHTGLFVQIDRRHARSRHLALRARCARKPEIRIAADAVPAELVPLIVRRDHHFAGAGVPARATSSEGTGHIEPVAHRASSRGSRSSAGRSPKPPSISIRTDRPRASSTAKA